MIAITPAFYPAVIEAVGETKPNFNAVVNADGSVTVDDWDAVLAWKEKCSPANQLFPFVHLLAAARGHIPEASREECETIAKQYALLVSEGGNA